MEPSLHQAWAEIILASDYELHMANVGQAEANARLTRDLVLGEGLPPGSRILFAGSGPGQLFEYVPGDFLAPHEVVFADINPEFVKLARDRAHEAGLSRVEALVDDIEATSLHGPFQMVVLVLVLEHVDWRKALDQMSGLNPDRLVVVLQRNPVTMEGMVTPHRELPGSLKACQSGEKPHLLDEKELVAHLSDLGYSLSMRDERPVPDGKSMIGLMFSAS